MQPVPGVNLLPGTIPGRAGEAQPALRQIRLSTVPGRTVRGRVAAGKGCLTFKGGTLPARVGASKRSPRARVVTTRAWSPGHFITGAA